jgi:hypothetical protein
MLTNMHAPPAEGNFCDEHGNAIKPVIVADYNKHMGYVDKADRMTNNAAVPTGCLTSASRPPPTFGVVVVTAAVDVASVAPS